MKFKTGIKGTPESGLQIPGFYKQKTSKLNSPKKALVIKLEEHMTQFYPRNGSCLHFGHLFSSLAQPKLSHKS